MSAPATLPTLAPIAAQSTLVELAAGSAVVAWLIDVLGRVGRGFRGTTALICAAVLALALFLAASLPDPQAILGGASPGAFASAVHWSVALLIALLVDAFFSAVGTDAARHVIGAATAAIGIGAVVMTALAYLPSNTAALPALLTAVPAALLAGSALSGMLLGHWYLLAPDLTFKPLRQAIYIVFGAVVVFLGAAIVGLLGASADARAGVVGGADALTFWLLVIGSGVVFTAAVNGLTLYFARIRANQPATAMLYVLIISALMGVVPASLVFLRTGVGI